MANLMSLRSDAAAELGKLFQRFQPGADRDTLLSQFDILIRDFHIIAVATLLVDGNAQGFFLNLCRAAENWRRLLALLRSRKLAPPPATKTTPLLAALAAGHFELADALASAPSAERIEGEEYEDEYLWASIFRHLARHSPSPVATVKPLVARLLKANKKEYASRCDMALALLTQDAEGFTKAFEQARLDYELQTEKKAANFATPVTAFAPHRFLWLEGLALLRLAERAGFALEATDYKYCPPLARVPMTAKYAGDWTIPAVKEP
ncbi:immunity 49 family protein [Hyalangium gracile]|uniref:immunity 49 family protein n=1 Tax=Hyalangium gracile TaxID=394092 RepID=UPI001CC90EBF|nr:immunity 49 family protein [Hyalangium gracile]